MNDNLFSFLYQISNTIYKVYIQILARVFLAKMLKMSVPERRKMLLENQFIMVSYEEIGNTQVRTYRHKSGMKITDRNTKYQVRS